MQRDTAPVRPGAVGPHRPCGACREGCRSCWPRTLRAAFTLSRFPRARRQACSVTVHGIQSTTLVLRAARYVLYPMFCLYSPVMHSPALFHRASHWQGNVKQGNERVRDTVYQFRSSYHHLERCLQKRHSRSRFPPSFCGSLLVSGSKSRERLPWSLHARHHATATVSTHRAGH